MCKRLASFSGPSSPSPNPVRPQPNATPTSPSSSSRGNRQQSSSNPPQSPRHGTPQKPQNQSDNNVPNETTYHRKLRSILLEIKATTITWDEIVLYDGLNAAKGLVDARTELSNALAVYPPETSPKVAIATPRLLIMEEKLRELGEVILKLEKCFTKLSNLCENVEELAVEASRLKGMNSIHEPLWFTWSLNKFAVSIPLLLIPHHRSLHKHKELLETLRPHSTPFDKARTCIHLWAAQEELNDGGWMDEWEDICRAEVRWWPDGMLPVRSRIEP
ncbi:uncharacterized protein EI90DRAFT_3147087 [Cantharellus anzutake]|uniref:uncharacterized protein n=1 Tax=Cantharellus anzutake TaxID=1750568 RepID=UPI001908E479|nr:uncharacterized protein EI90DRAFT_3147087 [Cantharellus anzutake]KAF8321441.1 hypothetical protein EI90DRAFT_3147087 [Cantharellus anzutake]